MAKTLYTAEAQVTGGRDEGHGKTSDGALEVDLRVPSEMGGDGGGTNPEQLFAAGYAACFANALRSAATRQERVEAVEGATVTAHVDIGALGKGRFGLAVKLETKLPKLSQEEAEKLVALAHERCPYSNATRGNIDVELTVEGVVQ